MANSDFSPSYTNRGTHPQDVGCLNREEKITTMVRARRYIYLSPLLALFVAVAISGSASAQNNYISNETLGPTASEVFSGTSTSVNGMLNFDTSVGWNFTKNFGADVGVPYFLITRPGIFEDTAGYRGYISFRTLNCDFFSGCFYTV